MTRTLRSLKGARKRQVPAEASELTHQKVEEGSVIRGPVLPGETMTAICPSGKKLFRGTVTGHDVGRTSFCAKEDGLFLPFSHDGEDVDWVRGHPADDSPQVKRLWVVCGLD